MPDPARSRIVVALDQPQRRFRAGSAPKSGVLKILAIFGAVLLVLVVCAAAGAFFWWQHYKTTPAYALALLVDAVQRDDMATVDQIVDTDKIVDTFAAQVTDKVVGQYGPALRDKVRQQVESLMPNLLPSIKQKVRDGVAARVKEISGNASKKPFVVIAIALPAFVNITAESDSARATTTIREQRVQMDLQRAAGAWKVTAVQDDALVQRIVDEVVKDLPALGKGNEQEIRKNLKKLTEGLLNIPNP